MARKVEELEKQIARRARDQQEEFRAWCEQFDAAARDEELETDIAAGNLDRLADSAVAGDKADRYREP